MLKNTKIHDRHGSLSQNTCDQGSSDDTDGGRVVKRRVRIQCNGAWHSHSVGHMKSMTRDYGHELEVALETDSVSGRGMSRRLSGKVRQVNTQWFRVQCVFHRREATLRKISGISNEANLRTKIQDGKTIQRIVRNTGYHCTTGRSQLAPTAAPDGLSRVGSDAQKNGKHQNRSATREHFSRSAD